MLQRFTLIAAAVLALSPFAFSQADEPQPKSPNTGQVSFELNWKAADPQWFLITVDATGRATYQSQPHTEADQTPADPFELKFMATEKIRSEIFDRARELNYFQGNLDYMGKERIARTGDKTLSYTAEGKTTKATFNWSPNPKAEDLASLFQQMSNCFELGRKLDYALRFDKLGVDERLKQLESLERRGYLPGVQVLVPILERVLNDPNTMNITRQRANYLLYAAKNEK